MLGGETEDDKKITLLNRTLIWTSGSITFEADPKHVREILSYFKFDSTSKGLHVPIVKETKEEVVEVAVELGAARGDGVQRTRGLSKLSFVGPSRYSVRYKRNL